MHERVCVYVYIYVLSGSSARECECHKLISRRSLHREGEITREKEGETKLKSKREKALLVYILCISTVSHPLHKSYHTEKALQ